MSQDELCQQASAVQISQGQMLNITLLASEWKSTAGGLSTLNRELAINLSQIQNVRVSLFVPEGACNDKDKMEAKSFGISILDAKKYVDFHPISWLSNPPQDHKIDVIVGHGLKLGRQVQLIKKRAQFQNCKWVHVVHTASEDLGKYKVYRGPISKVEIELWEEVDLCKNADLVVPVGPKLRKAYHGYLQGSKKKEDFFELIPGLFEREFADLCAKQNPKDERDDFIVLLCGHGDMEDFEVKGYNIAVKAFTDQRLKGKRCYLLFVGSPEGKQDEVREKLLKYGITDEQLTVREFVKSREGMKQLFCEVDMVINPSKSEGFGLVALEALSAGLPILVGSNSGFARAIENIPLGSFSVVDSEDPSKWAEGIEDVRDRHRVVLLETKMLRENYSKKYCWKTQCEELVDRLWNMVYGEERQPFPRLGEMRPALPIIPPLPTIRSGQDGAQGESELITTPDLASSFTRVARFEGFTFASAQREPLSPGEPGEIDPLQTSTRLTSLRSRLGLDRDGAFLDPEKYDPIKRLGSGGFAKVYMVRDKRTGKITACKMFDLGENDKHIQEKTKKVEQEVRILSALKHRFIVEFDHTDQRCSTFLIFMECMEGGSVAKLLNEKGRLEEPVVQIFTRQLLDAVDFLHNNPTKPVIHKDIKGANVLLDKLQKNIKLTDFGLCTEMNTLKTATGGFVTKNNIASFLWTSPEMLANKPFGRNTDIWSVGCTVIEMLTSFPPLMDHGNEHLTNSQRMYIIEHRELKPPGSCSPLVCRFLERCLSDREERPSASELLRTDEFVKFLSD